jgi:hypothetical protein
MFWRYCCTEGHRAYVSSLVDCRKWPCQGLAPFSFCGAGIAVPFCARWRSLSPASAHPPFISTSSLTLFSPAVYAFFEDYATDAIEVLEKEARRIVLETAARRIRRSGGGGGGAAAGGDGPTESALHEEIARGADALWAVILEALELPGDQFEMYALSSVFRWPEGLSHVRRRGDPSAGRGR